MPVIRPSSDLRNNYNEISTICHQTNRPVYITKNGAGDLAVMSIELYELLTDKHILYKELEKGISSLEKEENRKVKCDVAFVQAGHINILRSNLNLFSSISFYIDTINIIIIYLFTHSNIKIGRAQRLNSSHRT